jgi:hypothetical protein
MSLGPKGHALADEARAELEITGSFELRRRG